MKRPIERNLRLSAALLVPAAVAWACLSTPSPSEIDPPPLPATGESGPIQLLPEPTQAPEPTSAGECEAPAAEIAVGAPFNGRITGSDQPPPERLYYCVEIPTGVTKITFELTDMTAGLNLFVGFPDLKTVQEGGFDFWSSSEQVIVVEPGVGDTVKAGPYYIEISAEEFTASTPFTLLVSTP